MRPHPRLVDELRGSVEQTLGSAVIALRPVTGGDINDAYRAQLADGRALLVKTQEQAPAGGYTQEADGLRWLADGLRGDPDLTVAAVVAVHDPGVDASPGAPRWLALEWIDSGPRSADHDERLGRGLARLHAAGAPAFGATPAPGRSTPASPLLLHRPLRFAEVAIPNAPSDDIAEFFATQRIEPLTRVARDRGAFTGDDAALMARVCERLPQLVGPPEAPARIHGDLWSGNVMTGAHGEPILIDPAAHGGHRELDLATLEVFGGPRQRVRDAYDELRPLADDWQSRIALWQLHIMLLHVALFGGVYANQARALARRYA